MSYIIAGAVLMTCPDWRFWLGVGVFSLGSLGRLIDLLDG